MDAEQVRQLMPELRTFVDRYLAMLKEPEQRVNATVLLQGLLAGGDRRNVENIAEAMNGPAVRTLQKFVSQNGWDDKLLLAELRRDVVESFGDEDAVLNVDETGFPKKGEKSVGVKRQYSGALGRVDNCQVGVFVNYWSAKGHVLFDRRLFLPEDWSADRQRRAEAGVPEKVIFRTKPALALSMIEQAVIEEVPFTWVGGDSVYGDSPAFVQGLRELEKWYVLDTSMDGRVWLQQPALRPVRHKSGRPVKRPLAVEKPMSVAQAVESLPESAWRRQRVADGSQGPRFYDYAELKVWFSEEGRPAFQPERLLVRRSTGQEPEVKCQRSNAPPTIPQARLAAVGGTRWSIEQDFQAAKGECGLDEYETRGWTGWHHHTALSMIALMFLAKQRQRLGEKISADDGAGSTHHSSASTRLPKVGPTKDRRMVRTKAAKKQDRQSMPRQASSTRTR